LSESRFIQILRDPSEESPGQLTALDEEGRIWVLRQRRYDRPEVAWHEICDERVPYTEWKPLADAELQRNGVR
jgi:hypothetical protein